MTDTYEKVRYRDIDYDFYEYFLDDTQYPTIKAPLSFKDKTLVSKTFIKDDRKIYLDVASQKHTATNTYMITLSLFDNNTGKCLKIKYVRLIDIVLRFLSLDLCQTFIEGIVGMLDCVSFNSNSDTSAWVLIHRSCAFTAFNNLSEFKNAILYYMQTTEIPAYFCIYAKNASKNNTYYLIENILAYQM